MAKEIDPLRAKGALAVLKQHPGMVLFVASPGIIALVLVWAFVGHGWAVLLFLALVLAAEQRCCSSGSANRVGVRPRRKHAPTGL